MAMDAWERLLEISKLRFIACSANNSGWNCTGNGSVVVAKLDADTIMFSESGNWKSDTGQELNFNNIFRWSIGDSGGAIRLEHLRYGPNKPVFLFDLVHENENKWQSTAPYVCRDDFYSATMILMPDQIELQWAIKGPHKNEDIHYWYS